MGLTAAVQGGLQRRQGATVRFGPDRLDVEVPRRLQVEQIIALQEWLDSERKALDVSQVP